MNRQLSVISFFHVRFTLFVRQYRLWRKCPVWFLPPVRCPAVYAFRRRRKYARWAFPIAEFLTAIVSAVMLMKVLRKERSLTPNGGGENGKSAENLSGAFYFQKNDGWPEGNASGEHSERNG